MGRTFDDLAWHQAVARLIEAIDRPSFWPSLIKTISDYVEFDSWVALLFSADQTPVVLAEQPPNDGSEDSSFQDYLNGLYLLDPFYIAARSSITSGLVRLDDVAPDRFLFTDYYQRYFRLNIVEDEIQFNQPIDANRTLSLSLGAAHRFTPEEIAKLAMIQQWVIALMRQRYNYEQLSLPVQTIAETHNWQADLDMSINNTRGISLTLREMDVSRLMLGGYSSKGIAQKLAISVETVKAHKKHIYSKLGINSQSQLFSVFLQAQEMPVHQNDLSEKVESINSVRQSSLNQNKLNKGKLVSVG